MLNYVFRKVAYGILVLFGVVSLVFLIFSLNPGDPARLLLGQRASAESLNAINKELGLDLPKGKQYLMYINDISPISIHNSSNKKSYIFLNPEKYNYVELLSYADNRTVVLKTPYLRRSYQSRREVSEIIAESLPGTVILATVSMFFAIVIGITIGVFSSIYKGSFFDNSMLVAAVLGMSAPSFFMAIIIAWLGGYLWSQTTFIPAMPIIFMLIGFLISILSKNKDRKGAQVAEFTIKGLLIGIGIWLISMLLNYIFAKPLIPFAGSYFNLPGTGLEMTGSLYGIDVFEGKYLALQNLILPVITLAMRPLAIVIQLTRSSMLDVMSQDYIRTARAKGLSHGKIIVKHALRNALNPVLTAVSGWFASLLAGAVFIEYVFNWKGLGLQVFTSLENEDLPVVMGAVLVIAATFVIINIIVDILYGVLDPRIRVK